MNDDNKDTSDERKRNDSPILQRASVSDSPILHATCKLLSSQVCCAQRLQHSISTAERYLNTRIKDGRPMRNANDAKTRLVVVSQENTEQVVIFEQVFQGVVGGMDRKCRLRAQPSPYKF